MTSTKLIYAAIVFIAFGIFSCGEDKFVYEFTVEDKVIISELVDEFANGFIFNNPWRTLLTMTDNAVIIPHHGDLPVEGIDSIRAFWFPPDTAPRAVVEQFNMSKDEIDGEGDLAYVRGRFNLSWSYNETSFRNEGNYMMIVKRISDGTWRITHRIWNDPLPQAL